MLFGVVPSGCYLLPGNRENGKKYAVRHPPHRFQWRRYGVVRWNRMLERVRDPSLSLSLSLGLPLEIEGWVSVVLSVTVPSGCYLSRSEPSYNHIHCQ